MTSIPLRPLQSLARVVLGATLALGCRPLEAPPAAEGADSLAATYTVTIVSLSPPRFTVHAELPLSDDSLRVGRSRPCGPEPLCTGGWPSLISDLRVTDREGREVAVVATGPGGWVAPGASGGRVTLDYSVDLRPLAEHGWPAPKEAAYLEDGSLLTVGRPIFVGTATGGTTRVRFVLPPGTFVSAPWRREAEGKQTFTAGGFNLLANNVFVISSAYTTPVIAGGLALELALFGRWSSHRDVITRTLDRHLATFTRLLGFDEPGAYLAVFLEGSELGGEAYPDSYVISGPPDTTVAAWSRVIGHEVLHYWNGHRIRGADRTASQWFQEGMTEYYAIMSMARSGLLSADETLIELARHLRAHRGFGKSLVLSGDRKDGGFYGSATMVALVLDLMIRNASEGSRSLDDFMRRMWQEFGRTGKPYTQLDVVRVAGAVAGQDLSRFFQHHVEGDVPLPMDSTLALGGLKVVRASTAREAIIEDPAAASRRRQVWQAMVARQP